MWAHGWGVLVDIDDRLEKELRRAEDRIRSETYVPEGCILQFTSSGYQVVGVRASLPAPAVPQAPDRSVPNG